MMNPEDYEVVPIGDLEALTANGNPFQIELRGYEVARKVNGQWVQISRFNGSETARRRAVRDMVFFKERWGGELAVRPIISLDPIEGLVEAPSFLEE